MGNSEQQYKNMLKEIKRLRSIVRSFGQRLDTGRDYLMETPQDKIDVIKALEAFGFDKCGFDIE
jgi:hypothetical protein